MHHLNCNRILNEQFGCWGGDLSINDEAIFKLKHEILTVLSNKIHVAGIFCGLAKFHDMNHRMLQNYFITG
jgi:hypothetical protein